VVSVRSSGDDPSCPTAADALDAAENGCRSARRADCAIVQGFPKNHERGNRQLLHSMWLLKPTVEAAISEAVERGTLWLTNGPASVLGEPIPAGVLTPTATFQRPPDPIGVEELMAEGIPEAWKDHKTNALAISTALSTKRGKTLPWPVVRDAIDAAIRVRWIELADDDVSWPCEFAGAQHVVLQVPAARELGEDKRESYKPKPKGLPGG